MGTFKTKRLSMRPLHPEDQDFYCRCYNDPELMRHIAEPLSKEAALRSFKAALRMNADSQIKRRTWLMRTTDSNTNVGLLALTCTNNSRKEIEGEIGSIILTSFQNTGYAAEAISQLVNVAFEYCACTVLRTHHSAINLAANGLMEKLGFECEISNIHSQQIYCWTLTKEVWEQRMLQTSLE